MSLLRKLLSLKETRVPLEFGINENVRLLSIDNTERKFEGEVMKRNTYMKFAKFNSEDKIIGLSEFNYFNLDPESDYTTENFATQISQLNNIVKVLNPEASVDPTKGYEDMNELIEDLKSKTGCKKLMTETFKQFSEAVDGFIGKDSQLLRLKIITDKTGKYLSLPKDAVIVESMGVADSSLRIQPFELKNKENINTAITADKVGESPSQSGRKNILNI